MKTKQICVIAIAAGARHSVALKSDGSVIEWGASPFAMPMPECLRDETAIVAAWRVMAEETKKQKATLECLRDVAAIAAAGDCTLAWKRDGTVVLRNFDTGQTVDFPGGLEGVVAIAKGQDFFLALKDDGLVTAWGKNGKAETATLQNVVAIAARASRIVALHEDGTVTEFGECDAPVGLHDVRDVVAVAAEWGHTTVLRADGRLVAWHKMEGECYSPSGMRYVVAISAGNFFTIALKQNGTVVVAENTEPQYEPPKGLQNVVAISAGDEHALALTRDGRVIAWGDNSVGQCNVPVELGGIGGELIGPNDRSAGCGCALIVVFVGVLIALGVWLFRAFFR